jgi:hypothetical protein
MMMAVLESLRDHLADLPGVATSKIGLEANIGPSDYPLVRIVPIRITPGRPYDNRQVECFIYFGNAIADSEGLESVYDQLFTLEASIRQAVHAIGGRYLETVTDEDRDMTYKVMGVRCELFTNPLPIPAPTPAPAPAP